MDNDIHLNYGFGHNKGIKYNCKGLRSNQSLSNFEL